MKIGKINYLVQKYSTGNKITKPEIGVDVTWYTDRNRTNEYNFDNPYKFFQLYISRVRFEGQHPNKQGI